MFVSLFFNDTATTEIYTYCHTLSLHDALPISANWRPMAPRPPMPTRRSGLFGVTSSRLAAPSAGIRALQDGVEENVAGGGQILGRSEEHTSALQSLMRISYAVFCLKKKNVSTIKHQQPTMTQNTSSNKS